MVALIKKSCFLLSSQILSQSSDQDHRTHRLRGGWVLRKDPATLKQIFTTMITLWPVTLFTANSMLGKEKQPEILQRLKGSCYPETQSVIMVPL